MGYHLNHLDEPVFIAVSKLLPTEFGIHYRLETCGLLHFQCVRTEYRKKREINFGTKSFGETTHTSIMNVKLSQLLKCLAMA